jgi:hypothetical protein
MKYLYVIAFTLLLTNFWGATDINNTILLLLMLPFVALDLKNKSIFKSYILFVIFGLFCSILSCWYFRDQSILVTFKASAAFFYIIFYFALRKINLSIVDTERVIFVLTIILCICYILQFIVYPTVIFSGAEENTSSEIRIRLIGQGFSSLGFFYSINKFLTAKNKFYLLVAILCFCVIFLMGFRTMMVLLSAFAVLLLIRVNGFNLKLFLYFVLGVALIAIIVQVPIFSKKIDIMFERQKTENLSNQNYIRNEQLKYYTENHFKNGVEYFFGSGLPHLSEYTAYSNYMRRLIKQGITYVDFGLFSISWMIGIPTVLGMIVYSIKAYFVKVPREYYYAGIWFLYLVCCSFTTAEFFRTGNFVVQGFALYIIEKVSKSKVVLHLNNIT